VNNGALAKRYARAILDTTESIEQARRTVEEMQTFHKVMDSSKDLYHLLHNPIFRGQQVSVVETIVSKSGFAKLTGSLIAMLIKRGRIDAISDIAESMLRIIEEKGGTYRAQVASAKPLSDEQMKNISAKLESIAGHKLAVETEVDPKLLGGVVAKLGSKVYDGSIRAQLSRMEELLAREV